jgi:hypothetical protein
MMASCYYTGVVYPFCQLHLYIDKTALKNRDGVEHFVVILNHKVQVNAKGSSCFTGYANLRALGNSLPYPGHNLAHVGIHSDIAIAVINPDAITSAAVPPAGKGNYA